MFLIVIKIKIKKSKKMVKKYLLKKKKKIFILVQIKEMLYLQVLLIIGRLL